MLNKIHLGAAVLLLTPTQPCFAEVPAQEATLSTNPLATAEQIQVERRAIDIVSDPALDQARRKIASDWKAMAAAKGGYDAAAERELPAAVDEAIYANTLVTLSADPVRPAAISTIAAPHDWFGMRVPGSRMAFDNPDTVYRFFRLDPTAQYIIKGVRHSPGPVDLNFSVQNGIGGTRSIVSIDDLTIDGEGHYTITVDASAANGRKNHLQIGPRADRILVRDTINEWGEQQVDKISLERISSAPAAPAESNESIKQTAIEDFGTGADLAGLISRLNDLVFSVPTNTIPPLTMGGAEGRLVSQAATYSPFKIANDEALVLTVTLGSAKYFVAAAYNRWMVTTDAIHRTQSLNNRQAVPNPDGSFTFVISPTDPGVYNWIDTVGLNEGILNPRWHHFSTNAVVGDPSARLQLVKISNLRSVLPKTTRFVNQRERARQQAERAAAFATRYRQ